VIITAFDLATATGVCDGSIGGAPRIWSWYLSDGGRSRPARLLYLRRFLCAYFKEQPCDGVVYELPMSLGVMTQQGPRREGQHGNKRMMMSEQNVAFARGAVGVLEMTCEEFKKPVEGLAVQDARHCVLGWRINNKKKSNEDTKTRVFREVTKVHGVHAENDNETDAWVLWAFAAARCNPRLALAYTPLFRGEFA